jgi:serine/threonine-protein kinase HipA
MAKGLAVWLYGAQIAVIDQDRQHRPRLTYTPDALTRYEAGTPLLSLSLPVRDERFSRAVVLAFLDGLLPEGDTRRAIAEDLRLRADDTYGLIEALGRDCAGAIVVQPLDEAAPPPSTTARAEPLSEDGLADLIANLKNAPLGAGERVRVSLAGVQEKLLLTRLPDGRWGRPVDGTPSTHILKPEIPRFPNTVENEAFSMRLARHLGLPVADVETIAVRNRGLIVVTRFDRRVDRQGQVERVHQEDFCQATGSPPGKKYQEDGGPSLRTIAGILGNTDPESLPTLLRAVTFHVLVGNGDAHAKNYSLLHQPSGALRLSPLYDLMSTLYYEDDNLAMTIDGERRTSQVTAARIINEAASWGMARTRAAEIVMDLLVRVPPALDAAQAETPGLPDGIPQIVATQLGQLQNA